MRIFEITNNDNFMQIYVDRAKQIIDNYFSKPETNKNINPRSMLNQVADITFRPTREHPVAKDEIPEVSKKVAQKLKQMDELLNYIREKQAQ